MLPRYKMTIVTERVINIDWGAGLNWANCIFSLLRCEVHQEDSKILQYLTSFATDCRLHAVPSLSSPTRPLLQGEDSEYKAYVRLPVISRFLTQCNNVQIKKLSPLKQFTLTVPPQRHNKLRFAQAPNSNQSSDQDSCPPIIPSKSESWNHYTHISYKFCCFVEFEMTSREYKLSNHYWLQSQHVLNILQDVMCVMV